MNFHGFILNNFFPDRTVVSQNPEAARNNTDKKKFLSSDIPGPSSYKPLVKVNKFLKPKCIIIREGLVFD